MPVVTIPNVGDVEFPDTMDAEAIQRESEKLYSTATTRTATTPAATPATTPRPELSPNLTAEQRSIMAQPGGGKMAAAPEGRLAIADDIRSNTLAEAMIEQAQTELVKFTKMAPTAQEIRDARDVLMAANDGLASSGNRNAKTMQERLEGPSGKPETGDKIVAGAIQSGLSVPETFSSPLGIATLGTGALGATGARVVSGAFAADMLRHTPDKIVDVYEALKLELGPEEATRRIGDLALNTAMLAATAKHAATPKAAPAAPLEVAAEKAQEAGAPATAEALKAQAVETKPAVSEPISAPAETPASTPPVADVAAQPSATRTPEATAVEAGSKEPWQMRKAEGDAYLDKNMINAVKTDKGKVIAANVEHGDLMPALEETGSTFKNTNPRGWSLVGRKPSESYIGVADLEPAAGDFHKAWVMKAMREGKSIPEEVLSDYPDLKPTEAPQPKWTSATATTQPLTLKELGEGKRPPRAGEAGAINLSAVAPAVKSAARAVAGFAKEAIADMDIQKVGDRRRAVFNWSAKLQKSFGEAESAQRDIRAQVPDKVRREGVTNWIQAGGDAEVLAQRRAATDAWRDPTTGKPHPQREQLLAGYDAALRLTPEELAIAGDVKAAYDSLGTRGQTVGVLNNFVENYVTQIWDLGKTPSMGSSRTLKDQFKFSKARTFDTFFDGEQAGFVPKTKDISELLPVYLHEMNSVIAARQMVAEMGQGVASDGRPLLAPSGTAKVVDGPAGQAVLVNPKTVKGDTADYKRLENQPALNDWIWAGKDTAGKPVFEKSDLKLHPEAYAQLKNALGKSAIKEWYESPGTLTAAIPKAIVKGIDRLQSETKRTMLGFFAPFHQVQEGTHAVGHRINPFFNNPKIDLVNNAAQMDAARHGLMLLPDRISANNFMEGFRTSGIVSKIPAIGPAADWYSHYLFHNYIPGLKFKTYEAILERNQKVYANDLASGQVAIADVKALSATQANAAYGHLNYADMARNPTIQHIMQLGLLAPDFLEARARFFGQGIKGATGAKVGREQVLALATLAIAQAAMAYTAAKTTDGEWDGNRPFEFTKDGRRYTMRSVPEDAAALLHDIAHVFEKGGETPFISNRLSPLVGRGVLQGIKGSDYSGRPVTPTETLGELAKTPIPLTLRGAAGELPWVGDFLKPHSSLSIPEQLWSAVGIKISVDKPVKPEKPKRQKPVYK